jgi:hypothetical protein
LGIYWVVYDINSAYNRLTMFRSEGFDGRIVLISADSFLPYDRPTLSKNPDAKVIYVSAF